VKPLKINPFVVQIIVLYDSENHICDGNPNSQSHHPCADTATSIASDQILRILMENLSELLIEMERDSRDSRAGDALLLKHLSESNRRRDVTKPQWRVTSAPVKTALERSMSFHLH
jgi:hypothetical protein